MKQEASRQKPGNHERRRLGWGAALGFVLAISGVTLLLMVLMVVTLGTSWLPVYGAGSGVPPTLISRLAPPLAPAPTIVAPASAAVILPTSLPDEYFPDTAEVQQSGFAPAALLPQSPSDTGQAADDGPDDASADLSTRLEIPAIGVNAPIRSVGLIELEEDGQSYHQWQVPNDYVIGWHTSSAMLGSAGNTVLNGHNNVHGAVFRNLVELELGDEIVAHEDGQAYHYLVAHREVVEEQGQPLDVRLDNAKWMLPTSDERLTLISCWPDTGASHRVIVVATAVEGS